MSKIISMVPYLSINQIEKIKIEILLARSGEGWYLSERINDTHEGFHATAVNFIMNSKATYQCDVIIDRLKRLRNVIVDFSQGDFEKYKADYEEFADDPDCAPFDPFDDLNYLLATDGIADLPESIEQFKSLKFFIDTFCDRSQVMEDALEMFFGGAIKMHYEGKDSEGNSVMVPEDALPKELAADLRLNSEVKKEMKAIDIEHGLDNYNAWIRDLKTLVESRAPFTEMLEYIRE